MEIAQEAPEKYVATTTMREGMTRSEGYTGSAGWMNSPRGGRMLSPDESEDMKRLNYLPVFFVAAAVSMGNVLAATKGLGVLTDLMFAWMAPLMTNVFVSTVVLYWTAFVYHIFLASEISMLGTSIPLLMGFAKANGFNPLQLGMIWTFAAGGKIFAYQSAVMIVGYSYGFFRPRDLLRIGAWLSVIEFLIVLVLVPFYWPLIGIK